MKQRHQQNARHEKHKTNTEEDVQRRAYELYSERGQEPGHELDDWLQAEREVSQTTQQTTRP